MTRFIKLYRQSPLNHCLVLYLLNHETKQLRKLTRQTVNTTPPAFHSVYLFVLFHVECIRPSTTNQVKHTHTHNTNTTNTASKVINVFIPGEGKLQPKSWNVLNFNKKAPYILFLFLNADYIKRYFFCPLRWLNKILHPSAADTAAPPLMTYESIS